MLAGREIEQERENSLIFLVLAQTREGKMDFNLFFRDFPCFSTETGREDDFHDFPGFSTPAGREIKLP